MTKIQLLLCSASVLTIAAGSAHAAGFEIVDPVVEPASSVIGSVGLTFGQSDLSDDDGNDEGDGDYYRIDAIVGYVMSGGHVISLDLAYQEDEDIIHDFSTDSAFTGQGHLTAHYMYHMPSGIGIGAFAGVASAPHSAIDEDYTTAYYGFEGVAAIGPGTAFLQLAAGDTRESKDGVGGGNSSEGFSDGHVWRVGYIFPVHSTTDLIIDVEGGESDMYEDDDEPGAFGSVYLGGETRFGATSPWSMTYGVRQATFDAINDSDYIEENTVEIGFRYNFGGSTTAMDMSQGLIGTPHILKRANQIVPILD